MQATTPTNWTNKFLSNIESPRSVSCTIMGAFLSGGSLIFEVELKKKQKF
jgi:hypothetical protein